MQLVEYKVKRLILSPEEKIIKKSWGNNWANIKKLCDKNGYVNLVIGEWSGYNPKQRQDVHVDLCTKEMFNKSGGYYLGTIYYTDNTTLKVRIETCKLSRIFEDKILRKPSYTSLIQSLLKSDNKTYHVK